MWRRKASVRALQIGHAIGHETHPALDLSLRDWTNRVRELITHRTGRNDPDELETLVASSHCADLYLAIACDLGLANAWERFLELYEAQLADRAASLTIGLPKRERFVADFIAELFRATGQHDTPNDTTLGRYDGSASLMTFLLVLLYDKVLRARKRLESVHISDADRAVDKMRGSDHGNSIATSLASAWVRLSATGQFVLALRYEDELQPRRIADIVRRSEMQVRHTLRESLEQLRAHAMDSLQDSVPRQVWLDFQLWFEHEIDALTQSGRPKPADPQDLAKIRAQLETNA